MSTYICTKCGCVDNTSCGGNFNLVEFLKHYNDKDERFFKEDFANKEALCIECMPPTYINGSASGGGKWHGKFLKLHWFRHGTKETLIEKCKENKGDFVNTIEYFKNNK